MRLVSLKLLSLVLLKLMLKLSLLLKLMLKLLLKLLSLLLKLMLKLLSLLCLYLLRLCPLYLLRLRLRLVCFIFFGRLISRLLLLLLLQSRCHGLPARVEFVLHALLGVACLQHTRDMS